jgi:Sec-independent protein translocase protein TatA
MTLGDAKKIPRTISNVGETLKTLRNIKETPRVVG